MHEPKIKFDGDVAKCGGYIRAGYDLINDVMEEMKFNGIYQHNGSIELNGGVKIECEVIGQDAEMKIYVPLEQEEIIEVEEEAEGPPLYYFVRMWYHYVIGMYWYTSDMVSVYDVKNKKVATDVPLNDGSGYATFPCLYNLVSDFLSVPSEYVQPFDTSGFLTPDETTVPSSWETEPDHNPDCASGYSLDTTRTRDGRSVNGSLSTFTDTLHLSCSQYNYIDSNYHLGHTRCCEDSPTSCSTYESGDASIMSEYYSDKHFSFAHGAYGYVDGNWPYHFYQKYADRSVDMEFKKVASGGASYYTSGDIKMSDYEMDSKGTRTWRVFEKSCTAPGGIVRLPLWRITKKVSEFSEQDSQSVKNQHIHTPFGAFEIDDVIVSEYNIDAYELSDVEGGTGYTTVNGHKTESSLKFVCWPYPPHGIIWPEDSDTNGGNAIFTPKTEDEEKVKAYASIIQVYGSPAYYTDVNEYNLTDYRFSYPAGPTWDKVSETKKEYYPRYYAGIAFPYSSGKTVDESIASFNPHSMVRESSLESFFEELAEATIKSAPWSGGDLWEIGEDIRISINGHLQIDGSMVVYPYMERTT